jgi:hypothetical protein
MIAVPRSSPRSVSTARTVSSVQGADPAVDHREQPRGGWRKLKAAGMAGS